MSRYLGYDRGALRILLGALDAVQHERLVRPHLRTASAASAADDVLARYRRVVADLAAFAPPITAVLRADPLGAYRPVRLDPADLSGWALHRGGRWATVTDPTSVTAGWDRDLEVHNARLVARWLTPDRLAALLGGDGETAAPLSRHLGELRSAPVAGAAFLDELGAARFGGLVTVLSERFTAVHRWTKSDAPAAARATGLLDGLGRLWADSRAAGGRRTAAWDAAALGGPLYGASRLLDTGAATAGALGSGELAHWGSTQWHRLAGAREPTGLMRSEPVGDQILTAVARDGRAARRFLFDLDASPGRVDLYALLSSSVSTPPAGGRLLLASTDPSTRTTPDDEDEVRRSVRAVLLAVDHLLSHRVAVPPAGAGHTDADGHTLPTDLGTYTGRELIHLVDPCDGLPGACPPAPGVWTGWGDRQVAGVLTRLAADEGIAADLHVAALAGWFERVGHTALLGPGAVDVVRQETFAYGALDGILGDRVWRQARADEARFQSMVSGLDLAIDVAGSALPGAGPAAGVALEAWGPLSAASDAAGPGSLGELALSFLRPAGLDGVRARTEAAQRLTAARLERATGDLVALQQPSAARFGPGTASPELLDVDDAVAARAAATRPGDNANGAARQHLAGGTTQAGAGWRGGPGGALRDEIDHLQATVGDALTEGRAWIA